MMDEERPKPSATRDAHHAMSGWYDRLTDWGAAVERQALVMLSAREGEDIVNVGSGSGRALTALVGAVGAPGRVWGVDLSMGVLRRSQQRLLGAAQRRRVALLCGDAAQLPLRDSSADAALCILKLEVLPPDRVPLALAELRRVLRPGGRLVVAAMVEGRRRHPAVRLYRWARTRYPMRVNGRPIHPRTLLVSAGFAIVDVAAASLWGLPVEVVLATSPMPR
jgi:ubiquinone/menaquinone biosynthesis C-methylase UbiE